MEPPWLNSDGFTRREMDTPCVLCDVALPWDYDNQVVITTGTCLSFQSCELDKSLFHIKSPSTRYFVIVTENGLTEHITGMFSSHVEFIRT